MLDCNNFDERVEVDGVGKHSRRWSDRHYSMLGAVGQDLAPFGLVNLIVLDHLIDHIV